MPSGGVLNLWVELQPVPALAIGDGGAGGVCGARQGMDAGGQLFHPVAVAHPHRYRIRKPAEQTTGVGLDLQVGVAVFPAVAGGHYSAQPLHQCLHPVANAEHRQAAVHYPVGNGGSISVVNAGWPAGKG